MTHRLTATAFRFEQGSITCDSDSADAILDLAITLRGSSFWKDVVVVGLVTEAADAARIDQAAPGRRHQGS